MLRKSWDGVGLGWGGVGMVTFIELAHMVGATQQHVPCTCTHGRCYASHGMGWGWGGVGWAWLCSLNLHRKYHVPVPGISQVSRDGIEHRNVLAVHHINQRPGLATVLDALKKHRSLASRSFLSPSQVFKQPLWQV